MVDRHGVPGYPAVQVRRADDELRGQGPLPGRAGPDHEARPIRPQGDHVRQEGDQRPVVPHPPAVLLDGCRVGCHDRGPQLQHLVGLQAGRRQRRCRPLHLHARRLRRHDRDLHGGIGGSCALRDVHRKAVVARGQGQSPPCGPGQRDQVKRLHWPGQGGYVPRGQRHLGGRAGRGRHELRRQVQEQWAVGQWAHGPCPLQVGITPRGVVWVEGGGGVQPQGLAVGHLPPPRTEASDQGSPHSGDVEGNVRPQPACDRVLHDGVHHVRLSALQGVRSDDHLRAWGVEIRWDPWEPLGVRKQAPVHGRREV
mmetsp:Transcript_21141/g.37871  ORF Transcript_21141/g.37871 Transcript_21141/m.37871 type:complete len:310 (-) Transcript_21141:115-1044(-)